jgi:hypothetical protein
MLAVDADALAHRVQAALVVGAGERGDAVGGPLLAHLVGRAE